MSILSPTSARLSRGPVPGSSRAAGDTADHGDVRAPERVARAVFDGSICRVGR